MESVPPFIVAIDGQPVTTGGDLRGWIENMKHPGDTATVTMNAIDATGVGKEIGTLGLSDSKDGLQITPRLAGLPPRRMHLYQPRIGLVIHAHAAE